ncbi:translocation/assembly module TamB domain-containing protein [Filimonas lacunae]|uniref:translocation/assembly module TamB domain-containing protein n=1 Tax=Filimonas lacunae TaxID=477680 RepID=UPI001186D4B2|nr:translocation/assembly module TamB domain-containing protein [Filimonas lacunae]
MLIQTETVQNFIIRKVTTRLSKDLNTEVRIDHVSLTFFNKMNLEGTLIKDLNKDTLLYAGKLKIRITDWFFWKTKADLKYVGLEDAVIHTSRKDNIWNYQFIIDHFASTDTLPKKEKKSTLDLNLKKVDLKNVDYISNDLWVGERMQVKLGSLLLDADKIDFSKKIFQVNDVTIDKPYFTIQDFDGLRPPKKSTGQPVKDTGMYFNGADILVQAGHIKITNGFFSIGKQVPNSDPGWFDGSNIVFSNINTLITGYTFIKDTMRANINIAAKERSGLDVKQLKAQFRFTPQIMEFNKLDLRTNKSHLHNYYAMKYRDFNDDMGEYIDNVVMEARFNSSDVHSDDIAYFAPELRTWHKQVTMSGRFNGTVADFNVKDMFMRGGDATYLSGDFGMKGLPDIDKTNITLTKGVAQTNYANATAWLPPIKGVTNPNLAALGNVQFRGDFKGTIHSFTTTGNISTALGGCYTNTTLRLPVKGEPTYEGNITTQQFNLGKFIDVPSIGRVSFNGKIAGSSFDLDKIKTSLDGSFNQFEFNDYSYTNLIFNGNIQKKNFDGEFKANDPNFSFTSNIQIDLKDSVPHVNILGDLAQSNLQALHFTNTDFRLTGLFDLDFYGLNIDQFMGSAKLLNAGLIHDSTRLSFDSLTITANYDTANRRVLAVTSNEFDVLIRGRYTLLDLPNSFQLFLNKYFPSYFKAPAQTPKDQRFMVTLKTRNFESYTRVLDPKLSGLNNATLMGAINTQDSGTFFLRTNIPYVKYDSYMLENARLQGRGDSIKLKLSGDVGKVYVGDSLFFPNTTLNIQSEKDHSDIKIKTSANTTLNNAELNADVYTLEDGVRINFQPSSFVVNDKNWMLEKEGELIIRQNFASASNVRFTQGFQEMTVETEEDEGTNNSTLVLKLKDVNLGDFTPLFTKKPRMEGIANGNIHMHDFFGKFKLDGDLRADQFRLNDDSVGVVLLKGDYNSVTGKAGFNMTSDNASYRLNAKGSYNVKDSTGNPLEIETDLKEVKVTILNQLLEGLFSNITGIASGNLKVSGDPNAPELLGKLTLRNSGLKVDYTQVYYYIDSAVIRFEEDGINFGQFGIRDIRNNKGTVKGKLYEKGFSNMRFDFDMSTPQLLLLDTKAKDNQQFYGHAVGKATLALKGPLENMRMSIAGEVTDTTHIFIPSSVSKETAEADFIVFKKYGTEIQQEVNSSTARLSMDLDLTANNQATIDVILDELTGDVITATGNGRLQINVPATGAMTMKGRYNIESGRYNFNFQSFIRKPFILMQNAGSFIEWNGNPYDAILNIDAQYIAERVTLNELLSNQALNLSNSKGSLMGYRGQVYVIAELRGKLSRPDIGFKIDFPPNSVVKNDNDLQLLLTRIENEPNEMLKQVTYLIVFNSFAPYGEARTGANAGAIGFNTISAVLTSELNKLVSNFLYKITGDKSLNFDVGTSFYSSASLFGNTETGNSKLDRQNITLKVNKSLLDGKLIVTFGSDLDFNLSNTQAAQSGNFQWLPDIRVEIVLSRDRKLRAVVFNKSSMDVGAGSTTGIGRRNRQGVSISYTRDFEKIFGDKPKPQKVPKP